MGTNTLRSACNGENFRARAESALGHRVEVIAGREEARLIYLGVAHGASPSGRRKLVIDIGGGSTELIIGESFEPLQMESLYMGCVSMNRTYFGDGRISKSAFAAATLAARHELEPIENTFSADHWESAIGCSGTVKYIATVCRAHGWCEHTLTREALGELRRALLDAGHEDRIDLKELRVDWRPVLVGGLAVLTAAFDALQIEQMSVSELALREGLLYDLLGRICHEDVRGRSVRDVAMRYSADLEQAARVERTALDCLRQAQRSWTLDFDEHTAMLAWAAQLHEGGLAISHNQYHKHGAYVLTYSDLPGFSRQEQALLGALVRGHRRKFPLGGFDKLPAEKVITARRQCVLLRLAITLRRSAKRDRYAALRTERDQ